MVDLRASPPAQRCRISVVVPLAIGSSGGLDVRLSLFAFGAPGIQVRLLWGAGGWLLSVSCLNRIETFELSLLRRVIQVPRLVTENWVDYLKRSANVARGLLQKWGIDCLAVRVLTRIHGWSGHLVRLPATSPKARALKFRNEEWWANTQELGNPWDPLNRSGWRHSRPDQGLKCQRRWLHG